MVGLVIVAHSARLAEGVRELAEQMTQGKVRLAVAGGIDDPVHPFGTDAVRVQQAIESVYGDDGVVVLMDLGSALLSAEMALEFLPPQQRARVHLCEAPLVEGAIAAAVQAALGSRLDQVMAEARGALAAKVAQLQQAIPEALLPAPVVLTGHEKELYLTVRNRLGLHARPAAQFVATAGRFQSEITLRNVTRNAGPVSAKSINQVTTLGVRQGHEIAIAAYGPDADEGLAALQALVEANFGEDEAALEILEARPAAARPVEGALNGIPVSPGIALGPIYVYRPVPLSVTERSVDDPGHEWQRLQAALQAAREEIKALRARAAAQVSRYDAAIFDAHLLFLDDPAFIDPARWRILERCINAEAAWQTAVDDMVAAYQALDDPYMQARAADVADVGQRVLRLLAGVAPAQIEMAQPSILVAPDLTPSDTAQLDPGKVLGICTALGGPTSHSAILARALGIPAIAGLGVVVETLPEGALLALDGFQGALWVNPPPDLVTQLNSRRAAWLEQQVRFRQAGDQPAITRDGRRIEVAANVGSVLDAKSAAANGAEGIGLLRTEFLYLTRDTPPSEDEQVAILRQVGEAMGERPVIVRTLDVGGDKPLPYLDVLAEANPFLGVRGLRLSLQRPDLFLAQLRAILRAGADFNLRVMFPMVATAEEVAQARQWLVQAHRTLEAQRIPHRWPIETGIMIEIPAAALLGSVLAPSVDFFSIGTNDLTQYTLAAERGHPALPEFADALHPAVLRLVQSVAAAAHQHGKWVGVCGEIASDPVAVPVLVGLGVDELSLNPAAIPQVKATVRALDRPAVSALADQVLQADGAPAARRLAAAFAQTLPGASLTS